MRSAEVVSVTSNEQLQPTPNGSAALCVLVAPRRG
jgi:hypothetical protein